MRELLLTMVAMSSVDSLNPIGITQQFILQGMVKKPRHIWYFILTTGVVNIIFGYLVYYGVMAIINSRVESFIESYGLLLYLLELVLGSLVLAVSVKAIVKKTAARKAREKAAHSQKGEEEQIKSRIRSVTPLALIAVGVVSTVSELTSAVPYFAFLAVLINYKLSFAVITLILILYNIVYIAPFALLYFTFIVSRRVFDNIYTFFKTRFKGFLEIALPILFFVLSVVVLYDATVNLINL